VGATINSVDEDKYTQLREAIPGVLRCRSCLIMMAVLAAFESRPPVSSDHLLVYFA